MDMLMDSGGKVILAIILADNLAELCYFGWKVELLSEEVVYLVEISKQSVVNAVWFLLTTSY